MAPRRKYTARQRAEAVGIAVVEGKAAAARKTNIPRKTLAYWFDLPEFADLRQRKSAEVADDLWTAFQAGVRRIAELLPVTGDISKVAIATAIMYDKRALMTGGVTGRTESRALTEGLNDLERDALRRILNGAIEAAVVSSVGDPG